MMQDPGRSTRRRWLDAATGHLTSRLGWFVVGGTVVLLAISLLSPAQRDRAAPATPQESGELVILSGKDESRVPPTGQGSSTATPSNAPDPDTGVRAELINEWNHLHPETPARIEEASGDATKQHAEMVARAQSGAGDVDIYNLDVPWVAEFASAHYILPLDRVDENDFLAKPIATCKYQGKTWARPFNTDAGLLFYRADLVAEQDLPFRLPPDLSFVERLKRKDPKLATGYVGQLADYEGLTVNAMEAIWSAGGEVVNKDGDVAIDSAAAKLGLRQLAEEPSDPQVDARTYQEDDSTRAFREGKVALMRNWPVAYRRIKEGGEKAPSGVDVSANFAVAALRTPSVLGGQDLAISADTKKPLAARALIEFLIDPTRQKKLFEKGGLAAVRTSVYQDPGVRAQRPYADILRKAVDKAEPRPITPHYAVFSEAFRRVVNEALDNGGNLPSDAVRVLSDALQGYIR